MDIESEDWDRWETRFRELMELAKPMPLTGEINGAKHYLCLYGINGLEPDVEFAELEAMSQDVEHLKKVDVDTAYWQDTVLFIP